MRKTISTDISARAYNAAVDADHLRRGCSIHAIRILMVEGESQLADVLLHRDWVSRAADAVLQALHDERNKRQIEAEIAAGRDPSDVFSAAFEGREPVKDHSPSLDGMIDAAARRLEGANLALAEVQREVDAVADRIVARTPGAATADTGAV